LFVCHAHADNELCDRYVADLRACGLDVWYDRTNMQVGHSLSTDSEAELRGRTAFVVIATPASLASQWVRSEIVAFRSLAAHDPARLFLPLRAQKCEMPLLWADILWIDAVNLGFDAAVDALAAALGATATAKQAESVGELMEHGKGLMAQWKEDTGKEAEAIPFFERATKLDPQSFDAWNEL
jgi:hypothetical protein